MSDNISKHAFDDTVDIEDEDTCTSTELEHYFNHKYKVHGETAVSCDDSYVLRLAKDDSLTCVAAGLSDGSVRVFQLSSERGLYIEPPSSNVMKGWFNTMRGCSNVCGLRFLDETPNHLLVGTTNGLVRLLDLRTQSEASRFENLPDTLSHPRIIFSFDRNANSTLLCMGTVERRGNVYLMFYDIRTAKKIFSYIESHQDDITSVRFHPENPKLLCSGSTDGLINVFDVHTNDEDNALLTTINTESTVHRVNWHPHSNGRDKISCITHTNDFKMYKFDGDLIAKFDRLKITEIIKRKNEANCNLINCHSTSSNKIMLLTGSNLNNGKVMRSCVLKKGKLIPYANFEANNQIVRESILDEKTNILITAGEAGIVTLWTPLSMQTSSTNSTLHSSSLKMKSKKSDRVAPY